MQRKMARHDGLQFPDCYDAIKKAIHPKAKTESMSCVPPSPQSLLAFYHSPISSELLLQYRFSRNHFSCESWSRQQRCHQDGLSRHRPGPRAQRPCPALPQPVQLWASSQVPSCQQNLAAKGMLLEQGHRALQGSTHESNSEGQGGWKRTSP